ncbi:hypothetical protein LZK73_05530 [Neorhizobium galegae]|nr:hypothetical protein LZK73_05530 [Neorhizobium galegae]
MATSRRGSYAKAFEPWQMVLATGVYTDDLQAQIRGMVLDALAIGALALIIALAAAYVVIRGITKPLTAVHGTLQAVADENVTIAIPHTDMSNEVGMMAKATQALQEKIRERHAMAARQESQRQENRPRAPAEPRPAAAGSRPADPRGFHHR